MGGAKKSIKKQFKNSREKSNANLRPKPWKPGQSGNPKGRPKKGEAIAPILRELLDADTVTLTIKKGRKKKDLTIRCDLPLKYAICIAQIDKALLGDTKAFKEIVDRVDGKAKQFMALDTETPLQTFIIGDKEIVF